MIIIITIIERTNEKETEIVVMCIINVFGSKFLFWFIKFAQKFAWLEFWQHFNRIATNTQCWLQYEMYPLKKKRFNVRFIVSKNRQTKKNIYSTY